MHTRSETTRGVCFLQVPCHSFAFSGSPRRHQQRSDSVRHHWSLPPTVSAVSQSFSFLKGNGWGAVLADLERQVVDLKAQLQAPPSDPAPLPLGRGAIRRCDRSDSRGCGFFRGNAECSRGCASFDCQNKGSTSGAPTSFCGSRGRRQY